MNRTGNKQKLLIPKIRFKLNNHTPYPDWQKTELKKLAKRITVKNKTATVTRVLTNSAADGVIDQRDYFDREIANKENLTGYYIVENGDYVYNPRISNIAPVGPISKNKIGTGVMSPLYTVFRFKNKNNGFYEQYFKSTHWHNYLHSVSNHGARHDRMNITNDSFMDMPLPEPHQNEQQKIADCLSSVDELITAQAKKIESLQKHKKGLMQQLFPAEGDAAPKIRFKLNNNAPYPDWQKTELKKLAKRITVKNKTATVTRVLTNSAADGVIDQRDYFDRDIANKGNLVGYYIIENGDYVYNPRISNIAPIGPISKNKIGTGVMSPLYTVFRFKNKNNGFYEQYFKSTHWHNYLHSVSNHGARHDRMNITNDSFMDMPLPEPHQNEQQKIADCLTSLDELIAAETQKLDFFKTHKKGLMQQLFPTMDEVSI